MRSLCEYFTAVRQVSVSNSLAQIQPIISVTDDQMFSPLVWGSAINLQFARRGFFPSFKINMLL